MSKKVRGLVEAGNIDLANRPLVPFEGDIATVRSMSFNDGKQEVLIPTVVGNAVLSDEDAVNHYYETGQHLGKFETPRAATRYAIRLHKDQEKLYSVTPAYQRLMQRRASATPATGQ